MVFIPNIAGALLIRWFHLNFNLRVDKMFMLLMNVSCLFFIWPPNIAATVVIHLNLVWWSWGEWRFQKTHWETPFNVQIEVNGWAKDNVANEKNNIKKCKREKKSKTNAQNEGAYRQKLLYCIAQQGWCWCYGFLLFFTYSSVFLVLSFFSDHTKRKCLDLSPNVITHI